MKEEQNKNLAPVKLKLLVTVVNRKKYDYYVDYLQSFDANFQLTVLAHGTAKAEALEFLGLADNDRIAIFSIIKADKAHEALNALKEKFATIKNGKGIAYTVPLTSTIGVAAYRFLSNAK